jgi:hypothetical protein
MEIFKNLMSNKAYIKNLTQHYQTLMSDEIIQYIQYLKKDEKLKIEKLYSRLIEKYPELKVNFIGEKYTKNRIIESKAIYTAAKYFYENKTKRADWQRW